jgi:hypothetical protein
LPVGARLASLATIGNGQPVQGWQKSPVYKLSCKQKLLLQELFINTIPHVKNEIYATEFWG